MDTSKLAPFLVPKLKLFLSVDLVGSTALKQAGHFPIKTPNKDDGLKETRASWLSEVTNFYREIEVEFASKWEHYSKSIAPSAKWPVGEAPELWKSNGDELIYVKDLSSPREVYAAIICWMRAFQEYRKKIEDKKLDVKASAWVAGFPIANSETIFYSSVSGTNDNLDIGDPSLQHFYLLNRWYKRPKERKLYIKDYIGPAIDTGFRVASLATPRKFTISLETALLLSFVSPPDEFQDDIVIRYDGRVPLKGVIGGKPYPVFWVDSHLDNKLSKLEDGLTELKNQGSQEVQKFCFEFIKQYKNFLFRPFIHKCEEPLLQKMPKHYKKLLKQLDKSWKAESQKLEGENKALANEMPKNDSKNIKPVDDISLDLTIKKR